MPTSFIGRTDLHPGLRNNNPGNIKADGTDWQGNLGDDGTFVIFKDISWGLRALATDLANKINKGENTIRAIISVYAPPSENQTESYISAVSSDTGIASEELLTIDQVTLHDLMRAIINHENGDSESSLISDGDIDQGISMINANLLQLFDAAGIAIQKNPGTSTLGLAFAVGLAWWIFKK